MRILKLVAVLVIFSSISCNKSSSSSITHFSATLTGPTYSGSVTGTLDGYLLTVNVTDNLGTPTQSNDGIYNKYNGQLIASFYSLSGPLTSPFTYYIDLNSGSGVGNTSELLSNSYEIKMYKGVSLQLTGTLTKQ